MDGARDVNSVFVMLETIILTLLNGNHSLILVVMQIALFLTRKSNISESVNLLY